LEFDVENEYNHPMPENELVTTIPTRFEACKTCITAQKRIQDLASQTSIGRHPVKVLEIHLKCTIEPHSEVLMSGTVKKIATIEEVEKPLNGTLDKKSVYCPGFHGQ